MTAEITRESQLVQGLLDVLGNEYRRRILKTAVEMKQPLSPSLASKKLSAPLGSLTRHFRVLADAGLIVLSSEVPNRGGLEHFYLPAENAIQHPIVQAVLSAM